MSPSIFRFSYCTVQQVRASQQIRMLLPAALQRNVSVREGGRQNGIEPGTVPSRTDDPRHPRHHRLNFL